MRSEWLVYWLYDDACICYERHGCIGAVKETRLYPRLWQHQQNRRIPKNFEFKVIFRGSRREAYKLEATLRPAPYIGWNIGIGGFANGGGLKGLPKSPETRERMRIAALHRYADPAEKEKTGRSLVGKIDNRGKRNPMYGRQMSEAAKEKVRAKIAERNIKGANNPNYRHGRYMRGDPSKG